MTAYVLGRDGKALPGVAPMAKHQGHYVARLIAAWVAGGEFRPFAYRDFGSLATIGRKRVVVEMGLLWSVAHIYFLIASAAALSSP